MISLPSTAAKMPGPKSHRRVHLVYFALGEFRLAGVLAGLVLSSHFASVFERTVDYRQSWDAIFTEMWELNDLVMETSAPVVEMFETGDPVGKSKNFEANLKALEQTVARLQQELNTPDRVEPGAGCLAALHLVRSTLKLVAEHGRSVFFELLQRLASQGRPLHVHDRRLRQQAQAPVSWRHGEHPSSHPRI